MLGRRLLTVPGYAALWVAWLATAPLWLPLAALVDLARRSGGVAVRSAGVVTTYLTYEVVGVTLCGGLWLWRRAVGMDDERWIDLHFRLEAWWGAGIFGAVVRCFGLRLEVEGDSVLDGGPYLLLLRHASAGDTLLASALASGPHRMRLRYVLKRELLWDPCLDIAGHRVPNVFVDRSSEASAVEIARVRTLGLGLGPRDGVLIYPEGTRFSERKRSHLMKRFAERDDPKMLDYTRSLASVLPPRPGGTLALLEAAPDADVVVCAPPGFEGAASLAEIWRGALLHRTLRVEFRRIPRAELPEGEEARAAWLLEEWRRVDAWVTRHRDSVQRA